jgi:hypothetical protein
VEARRKQLGKPRTATVSASCAAD